MRHLAVGTLLLLSVWQSRESAATHAGPEFAVKSTATIVGFVVTDTEPESPVARAIVTVSGRALTATRSTVTDDDGRFALDGVPPGQYSVRAEKAAFITSEYGSKRPGRPGVPVRVDDGTTLDVLTIRLARGAAVAGIVSDQTGFPVSSASVSLVPLKGPVRNETFPSLTNNGARTNHLGEYRIFGLEPGTYLVKVTPSISDGGIAVLSEQAIDRIFAFLKGRRTSLQGLSADMPAVSRSVAFTPVYFPNTPDPATAATITLGKGEERLGVDVVFGGVPVSEVQGMVVLEDGRPAVGASVFLRRQAADGPLQLGVPSAVASDASGRFRLSGVAPGHYRLFARVRDARQIQPGAIEAQSGMLGGRWASTMLTVSGADVSGLWLDVRAGITLDGRVAFSGSTAAGVVPTLVGFRPVLQSDEWGISMTGEAQPDGSFAFSGLPGGSYRLQVNAQQFPGWFLESAMVGDADMLDVPVELPEGARQQVVVTFSDRQTQLSGRLQTKENRSVSDVVIIAFSADARFWRVGSRRIRTVRPASDGTFRFPDLIPGEYHLAALLDVDPDEWLEPGYLEALRASSVEVSVKAGVQNVQNLMIQGIPTPLH